MGNRILFGSERLGSVIKNIFPNPPMAFFFGIGMTAELVLLSQSIDDVFGKGGATPFLAFASLTWFWLTLTWLVWWGSVKWDRGAANRSQVKNLALGTLLTGTGCAIGLFYATSWGFYLQTGRFANLEALHFIVANPRALWDYVLEAEPTHLFWLALFGAGMLGTIRPLARWFARAHWKSESQSCLEDSGSETEREQARAKVWTWTSFATLGLALLVTWDSSLQRKTIRLDALKYCLNPVIAAAASGMETIFEEPIAAVLDVSELVPLTTPATEAPSKHSEKRPSIIFLAIESLRPDVVGLIHQGIEVTPNLNRLAREGMELTNAYAQSTHSDYADVCLVSSLYPLRSRRHHYYRPGDPWPKTLIYDVLKPLGYSTAIISSQNEAWGGMDHFLDSPNLDRFYHPERSDGAATIASPRDPGFAHELKVGTLVAGSFPDRHTTGIALEWLSEQHAAGKPFYLGMNFQSSHFPYMMPEDIPRPFQPCALDSDIYFMHYPVEKKPQVWNAYLNAIHECDRQIGRLVARLKKLGTMEEVILVVTGENGESFHESGSVGHAREPVESAVHIACVIHAPKYLPVGQVDYPMEHVDLTPTVLAAAGIASSPNFQGIDILSPGRPAIEERLLFFHVLSPAARADAVQWAGRWKYQLDHNTGRGTLYDLVNDPGEEQDLSMSHPSVTKKLHQVLLTWRKRQLAYYHYPMYYQSYYPPKPPKLDASQEAPARGLLSRTALP